MTAPKVHIWRTALSWGTGPRMAKAWCGLELPADQEWAVGGSENSTCLRCIRVRLDYASWKSAEEARVVEALLPVERRLSRKTKTRRKA